MFIRIWGSVSNRHQISLQTLSKFKRINELLFPLKLPEKALLHRLFDDIRGEKNFINLKFP